MLRTSFRPVALSLAMLIPISGYAQGRPVRSNDAGAHFERGATFYGEGDYAAAVVEFRKAYELDPAWQVLFNLGQAYFQLRDYANALTTLQRFAAEGGERIAKEDRATLDSELPDLANRVGRVTVESNVEGASVLIDEQPVGKTPMRDPVLVSAGMRRITAVADGRAPVGRVFSIGSGDAVSVRLDFLTRGTSAPDATDRGRPEQRTDSPSRAPAYVAFGLAGAGLATGAVFGVLAMQDKSRLDRACTASRACPPTSQSNVDAMGRDGVVSTVGFGVGGAMLALGVVLWLVERPSPASTGSISPVLPQPEAPRVTLRIGPGLLTGSF